MRCLKFACLSAVTLLVCAVEVKAQGFGLRSRIANLPVFNRDDASSAQSAGRNVRSPRSRQPVDDTHRAPAKQSNLRAVAACAAGERDDAGADIARWRLFDTHRQ